MRVAVIGAGGTGGLYGALLARSGAEVTFIARGAHLEAIQTQGLRVKSHLHGEFTVHAAAASSAAGMKPVDLVLFGVKAYDAAGAAELMRPLVGPETVVLPVQNGIDTPDRLSELLGARHVLGGVTYVVSHIEAPGVIHHKGGPGKIQFGEMDGRESARTRQIADLLNRAGIPVEARTDIAVAMWEKFVFITAFSGVTAVTRLPIDRAVANPETLNLYGSLVAEAAAVARAAGVAIPANLEEKTVAAVTGFQPGSTSSLLQDLVAGKRLEVESLQGTVVRLGRRHGVPTPLNFAVYAALKPHENGTAR